MKFSVSYTFEYTTSGGAHRYKPTRKSQVNVGNIYLRGIDKPPPKLKITVEQA